MRESVWKDYELLDTSDGQRLERWGDIILVRPDPQVIWSTGKGHPLWGSAHAVYSRSKTGGGAWEIKKDIPGVWIIEFEELRFRVKPMGFKHTGIFPEQAVNWKFAMSKIKKAGRPIKVLNLFGYTGAATVACLKSGAHVTHVDASKGMVQWARENAEESGVAGIPVRWLVDDCIKFVQRECRRGNVYDAVIMDPPSYGRGPGGEVWKLEDNIFSLIEMCMPILSGNPLFFMINSYTAGLSPSVMAYILKLKMEKLFGGRVSCDEIGIPVTYTGGVLPCGSTAVWESK